jgi:hypothetical protein
MPREGFAELNFDSFKEEAHKFGLGWACFECWACAVVENARYDILHLEISFLLSIPIFLIFASPFFE